MAPTILEGLRAASINRCHPWQLYNQPGEVHLAICKTNFWEIVLLGVLALHSAFF